MTDSLLLRKYCLTSALLAGLIMFVFYFAHTNTLVIGDSTVLRMDLYHQYGPLYAEVYDRITNGQSLVYSWTSGLGASFLGNLFNYCSSPFALFMLICGHKNMPEAIALMIAAKAMLAAGTFTYFINKSNKCVKKESVAFGLFYAFTGYFVAYSWNIMWFDAVAVFPLLILGIERIIDKNKPGLYIGMMTFTMISNYYMAYMVCILSVAYFLYYYFGRYELSTKIFKAGNEKPAVEIPAENSEVESIFDEIAPSVEDADVLYTEKLEEEKPAEVKKEKTYKFRDNRFWVTGWSFAISSFLAFALAAFALLPIYFCLQSSSATAGTFPEDSKQYFDIFRFLANHLTGIEPTIRSSGDNVIPNVYCGLLTVILLPFYFLSDRIPGKQKVAGAILLGFCLVGFALNYANYVWHGFHMPNDLPYRWSFAYSFFLLLMSYKAFRHIKDFSNKAYIGMGFAVLGFVVLVEKIGVPNADQLTIILSCVFTVLYIVILGMMRSPRYKQNAVVLLLLFTVILEIVAADTPKLTMAQSKTAYTSDYENYQELSESVEAADDELFYRTELAKLRARMDPSWYGYSGVSVFSSMAYEQTAKAMENLGFFSNNINSYTYYPQTPIVNSLLSVRYIYDNMNFLQNDDMYTLVGSNEDFEAFRYNYYLPLIVSVDRGVTSWDTLSSNPFTVQNELMKSAVGIENVLIPVEATQFTGENMKDVALSVINSGTAFTVTKNNNGSAGKAIVTINPDSEGNYYIYVGSTKLSSLKIEAKDLSYTYNSSAIEPFVLDVGYLTPDDEIVITYSVAAANNTASLTFCAAKLDEEKWDEAYSILQSNGTLNMTSFDETELSGTINVTNDNALLWTSIPYDESWEIIIDGEVMTYSQYDKETGDVVSYGDIEKIGGGFIGINTEKGGHTIEMKYKAKGLRPGSIITLTAATLLVIFGIYQICNKKRRAGRLNLPVFLREPDFEND